MPELDNKVENTIAPKKIEGLEEAIDKLEGPIKCPVCNSNVKIDYKISDSDNVNTAWNHCQCDSIFHTKGIDQSIFNKEYLEKWETMKEIKDRFEYLSRCYFSMVNNIAGQQTYGRKFLDVGFTLPVIIEGLKEKGWITTGIDLIPNDYITGDFMTFEFEEKFDCILMGHVLECLIDPIKGLEKAFSMIDDMGCLVITHPSPELIRKVGPMSFGHFSNYKEKHIFLSRNVIKAVAAKFGFAELLYIKNECQRFAVWNDAHYIFQKRTPY